MNKLDTVIDALHRAIEMEQGLQDYYKRAAQHAKDPHLDDRFHGMEEGHRTFAGHLETHREELQRQAGEGVIANAIEAIGDAIYDLLAGLPVAFIHNETNPTIEMLLRHEGQLLEVYRTLQGTVGAETATLIAAAAENVEGNIAELKTLQPSGIR